MLELDLVLARFVERHLDWSSADELTVFKELLAYEDTDLFDMVMGRAEPEDKRLNCILDRVRHS
jgi:succinate dehydrogenase flavin-adding protein (antitoxin of CptAB toxin-antitoxin module)